MELKQIIKNEHIEMLINGLVPKEPIHISIKRDFDTACWNFNEQLNKHSIYVGENILKRAVRVGTESIEYYATSYLHHEMSHSLYTFRDLKFLNEMLKRDKIPFKLLNLFEDARIENIWREKTHRMFKWAEYEELPTINEDSTATYLLFVLIQNEGMFDSEIEKLQRVKEYYTKILDCKETMDLYSILLDWIEEFPETNEDLDQMENDGYLSNDDLSISVKLQSDEYAAEEMDENTEDVVGSSPYKSKNEKVEVLSNIEYDYSTTLTNSIFDATNSYEFDKSLGNKLIPIMQKIFKTKNKKISQSNATNKLNTRNFLNSRFDKLYKKKIVESRGKKKINLIIDCSGSMSGSPIKNARTFCYILNEFAKNGYIDGYLTLTGGNSNKHQCLTMKFPINNNDISHIIAKSGAEGLERTIEKTKKLIMNSDWTFVLTDGDITDNAIKTKDLPLFGMYVGDPESCNLSKWFSKYIARNTLDELIQVLINKL